MPKSEEQRRADKAAYMRRKRAEHHAQMTLGDKCLLDRQLQTPTDEQREQMASQIAQANGIVITEKDNIQDLERRFKEAVKRDEQARMQDFRRIAQATPNPLSKEQQEQAVQQILKAHPELEEQFRKAQGNSEIRPFHPGVLYQDHREQAQAILADAEERQRRVQLIMSQYQKDACNTNALLWHLLETFTLMRLELTDLIGSLRK